MMDLAVEVLSSPFDELKKRKAAVAAKSSENSLILGRFSEIHENQVKYKIHVWNPMGSQKS